MEILFLYHRLYHTAEKQLESLRNSDFQTLEDLTQEREQITRELCESFAKVSAEEKESAMPRSVQNKIHELTAQTLNLDAEIKEALLEELRKRTLELSTL